MGNKAYDMKNIILFIFILFSKFLFSQATDSAGFNLTINFEKDIPVENLQVYCYTKAGNTIQAINIKIDKTSNSINLSGTNSFVIPVNFPTLFFLYTDKAKLHELSDEKIERNNVFYLATGFGITSYNENINHIVRFSKEKPNILITLKNKNGQRLYEVQNFDFWEIGTNQYLKENLNLSNSTLRLK